VTQVGARRIRVDSNRSSIFRVASRDVTERHLVVPVAAVRVLIAGRLGWTRISRAHTALDESTDLLPGAKESVVWTEVVVRRVHAELLDLVAGVESAVDAVTAVDRRAGLAGPRAVAGLVAIAELSIRTGTTRRLELAARAAAVAIQDVPVVTLLAGVDNAISAAPKRIAGVCRLVADRG